VNLENQVCSLELSKRLKELGIKQESLFYWIEDYELYSDEPQLLYAPTEQFSNGNGELDWPRNNPENCHSAFTVAELGELLPSHRFVSMRYQNKNGWRCKDRFGYASIQRCFCESDSRKC